MENAVLISPDLVVFVDSLGAFIEAVEDVMAGRSTAEEAMSQLQRQYGQW